MSIKQFVKDMLPAPALDWARAVIYRGRRLRSSRIYQGQLRGKTGIEIGGPSIFFRHVLPIYPVVAGLDGVNFATETMWEGRIRAGEHFNYGLGRVGRQFIAEAADLAEIQPGGYQFLISSNCLEHVANPLKALREWVRVVEPGGLLLLVIPNQTSNFDHLRPVTQFEHLLADYENGVGEDDMTHLPEILELHDLARDPWAGTRENFVKRCYENKKYRGMHHHVFDLPLIERTLSYWGVSVLRSDVTATDFVVLGRTAREGHAARDAGASAADAP